MKELKITIFILLWVNIGTGIISPENPPVRVYRRALRQKIRHLVLPDSRFLHVAELVEPCREFLRKFHVRCINPDRIATPPRSLSECKNRIHFPEVSCGVQERSLSVWRRCITGIKLQLPVEIAYKSSISPLTFISRSTDIKQTTDGTTMATKVRKRIYVDPISRRIYFTAPTVICKMYYTACCSRHPI
jgi:hypothetical protein